MGLEFRESLFVLGPKSNRPLKSGMIVNLTLGFANLEVPGEKDSKRKSYALLLSDTVQINHDGTIVLTQSDKELAGISYAMGEDEDDLGSNQENIKKRKQQEQRAPSSKRTAVLDSRRRDDTDKASDEEKRRAHQKALALAKQQEGVIRFTSGDSDKKTVERAVFRKFESYRKDVQLPRSVSDLKVCFFSNSYCRLWLIAKRKR